MTNNNTDTLHFKQTSNYKVGDTIFIVSSVFSETQISITERIKNILLREIKSQPN